MKNRADEAQQTHLFPLFSSPTSQIQTHHSHITNPNPTPITTSQKSKPDNHILSPNSTPINQIKNLKSPLKYHTNPNKTHKY